MILRLNKIFNFFRQNFGGEDVKDCSETVTFRAATPSEPCGGSGMPPGTRPESCKHC